MSTHNASTNPENFPLSGLASDGFSTSATATATCFCASIQIEFPTKAPGLINTFLCHCHDCRKITASMFASNFTVRSSALKYKRGKGLLKEFAQRRSIASGNTMTNSFCSKCGTLLFRTSSGAPSCAIMRLGTVDDFSLHEKELRPQMELFSEGRVGWLAPTTIDAEQVIAGGAWGKKAGDEKI